MINPIQHSQACLRELARLRDHIRRLDQRIEGRRRRHRLACARRMRRWLQSGGVPRELLRTMHREKQEQLQGRTPEQAAYLADFFDLGIQAAEAASQRLLTSTSTEPKVGSGAGSASGALRSARAVSPAAP